MFFLRDGDPPYNGSLQKCGWEITSLRKRRSLPLPMDRRRFLESGMAVVGLGTSSRLLSLQAAEGELTLTWTRPAGLGHKERGSQVAEVCLIRK